MCYRITSGKKFVIIVATLFRFFSYRWKISNCGIYDTTYKTNMASNRGLQIGSAWFQRKINLRPQHRGVHLVTEEILRQMPELGQFSVGLCHVQSKCFYRWLKFPFMENVIFSFSKTLPIQSSLSSHNPIHFFFLLTDNLLVWYVSVQMLVY